MRTLCVVAMFMMATTATAQSADFDKQARNLYSRLNGVPPTPAKQRIIAALLEQGSLKDAALMAIEDEAGLFYSFTLKNMVTPWTNEAQNGRVELNDYSATVVGMVRDEIPFNEVLTGDFIWVGEIEDQEDPLPEYSYADNEHFAAIEARGLPLHTTLVRKTQSELTPLPDDATAGVLTTRGFASQYFNAGTNRAVTRFTLMTYMCRDMEELTDNTRPDFRVRRDVSRSPGGDTPTFRNKCAGCHAGMDALTGATAYYDYDEELGLIYNPTSVPTKINRAGETFPDGFVTSDESWINLWVEGPNANLGWNGAREGRGLKSWGKMITNTDAFSQCMAEQVLETVCFTKDASAVNLLANSFRSSGKYNMKHLFAEAALMCRFDKKNP